MDLYILPFQKEFKRSPVIENPENSWRSDSMLEGYSEEGHQRGKGLRSTI